MDHLHRGWVFYLQAYRLARANPGLLMPPVYGLLTGLGATLIGLALIFMMLTQLANRGMAQFFAAFIGALILCAHWITGWVFSSVTVRRVYAILNGGETRTKQGWGVLRSNWLDLIGTGIVTVPVAALKAAVKRRRENLAGSLIGQITGAAWSEATYLWLPVMVVENLDLKQTLKRTAEIVRQNLLMAAENLVGVRLANTLAGVGLTALGSVTGIIVGRTAGGVWGIMAGMLIASLIILVAVAVTTFVRVVYHTSLYVWVAQEEHNRNEANTLPVMPPAPLAEAYNGLSSLAAPLYYES